MSMYAIPAIIILIKYAEWESGTAKLSALNAKNPIQRENCPYFLLGAEIHRVILNPLLHREDVPDALQVVAPVVVIINRGENNAHLRIPMPIVRE